MKLNVSAARICSKYVSPTDSGWFLNNSDNGMPFLPAFEAPSIGLYITIGYIDISISFL